MKKFWQIFILLLGTVQIAVAQSEVLYFDIKAPTASYEGQQICADVTPSIFKKIMGFQFAIQWNAEELDFQKVILAENLSGNLDFRKSDANTLRFLWLTNDFRSGSSLPNESSLFQICFKAKIANTANSFSFAPNVMYGQAVSAVNNQSFKVEQQTTSQSFVYPGDVDLNEEVSHLDLLPIGQGFGQNGLPRADASIEYIPQIAENWDNFTTHTNINYKHLDTDGNGIISEADLLAINQNWDKTTLFPEPHISDQIAAPLYVSGGDLEIGITNALSLQLGTVELPVQNIYGIAFSISHDGTGIAGEKIELNLTDSWLGKLGKNLLMVQQYFPNENRLDVAITRTNHQPKGGFGTIGKLEIVMEDVILFGATENVRFQIEHVKMLGKEGEPLAVAPEATNVSIIAVDQLTNDLEEDVQIFPNPAEDRISMFSSKLEIVEAELYDAQGELIMEVENPTTFNIKQLPRGAYLLKIQTSKGVFYKSIIIQ